MAIEIVDLPIKNGDVPYFFVWNDSLEILTSEGRTSFRPPGAEKIRSTVGALASGKLSHNYGKSPLFFVVKPRKMVV